MSKVIETEIKLVVSNLTAARSRVRSLGFRRVKPRQFESNILFDFPDQRLRKARCLLRVRKTGGDCLLTFKGPPADTGLYKSREELETRLEDGGKAQEILVRMGMRRVFRYDKFRTVFAPPAVGKGGRHSLLTIDETPIGNYLELEGPDAWIDRTAAQLGYRQQDYITASYAALYRLHCEALGRTPAEMVFESNSV